MQVKAQLKYLKIAPKKVRLVADLIRGLKVAEAQLQLGLIKKNATKPLLGLLNSAISNAANNFSLKKDNLFIKEIKVNEAGSLKRWLPRAHGRATPIKKRMSQIFIMLDELVPTKMVKAVKTSKTEKIVKLKSAEQIKEGPKPGKVIGDKKGKKITRGEEKEINKVIEDVRMEGKHRHKQNLDKRSMKKGKGFITKLFNRKSG